MKKIICIFIVLIIAGMSVGCASPSATKISAEQAHIMMDQLDNFLIVDTRSLSEFNQGHIRSAVSIPYDEITRRAVDEISDKDIVILVYCQAGRRSAIAAQRLADLGFTNVYDFGGLNDWPFGTVTNNLPTNSAELIVLFNDWATTENRAVGSEIMHVFQENIAVFIEAMQHACPSSREQVLMLVGAAVAEARMRNPVTYANYVGALEYAENLNLDNEQRQILRFIRANIAHAMH
ncbi:MAG: rhodanese-like domain-containing protein [Bacteroidales bacterium]|nr:rhodanese-like domain-containing protein [Bacteroidales bacterium]